MTGHPTHNYIGKKACGCVVAVVADMPGESKRTATWVAGFIRDGLSVERIAIAELAQYYPLGCKCPKETQEQLPLIVNDQRQNATQKDA